MGTLANYKSMATLGYPFYGISSFGNVYDIIHGSFIDSSDVGNLFGDRPLGSVVADIWWQQPDDIIKNSPFSQTIFNARDYHLYPVNAKCRINDHLYLTIDVKIFDTRTYTIYCGEEEISSVLGITNLVKLYAMCFVPVPAALRNMGYTPISLQARKVDQQKPISVTNIEWTLLSESAYRRNSSKMTNKQLTDKEIKETRKLLSQGYTDDKISEKLNISRTNVYNIRNRTTEKYRGDDFHWDPAPAVIPNAPSVNQLMGMDSHQKQTLICNYHDRGYTVNSIAIALHTSDNSVKKTLMKNNRIPRTKRSTGK